MKTTIQNNIDNRLYKSIYNGGNMDEITLLIDLGADIHINNDGLLRLCAQYNHIKAAKLLLKKRLDINACVENSYSNDRGMTALHYAAQYGHTDMVTFLLDNKADIEQKSKAKLNALYYAVDNNKIEVVKLLLERGADIHAKGFDDEEEYNALLVCSITYRAEIMKLLLEKGADASNPAVMKNAIAHNNIKCVKLLLDYGANLSTISNAMDMCPSNNIEMIKLLIDNGAIYSQKDNKLSVAKLVYDNRTLQEKVDKLQKQLDDIKQVINTN